MEDLQLNVSLNIDNPKVKADTADAKASVEGIGESAENAVKRVEASMKRISVLDDASLAHLQKMKDAKKAMYDEAAKSLETPKAPVANNLPSAVEQVNKLTSAQKASNAAAEIGGSIVGDLVGTLTIWGAVTTVVTGLFKLYKEEIISWATALITGKDANDKLTKSIEAQNEALGSGKYKDAIANVTELTQMVDDAKNGFLDKTKVVDHYNETMGKTAGVVKTVDEVQQRLLDKGDAYIQMTLNQAAANIVLEQSAQKAAEAEMRKLNAPSIKDYVTSLGKAIAKTAAGSNAFGGILDEAQLQKLYGIAELKQDAKQGVELFKELTKANNEFAKANGLNSFNDSKVEKMKKDPTINERKNLLSQLEALDNEYKRKSFSKDEEEIQAIKDKFERIRVIIAEFNKKNPKSAISLVEFNATEGVAIDDLKYRQSTDKFKTSLDEQKKLYDDFESYKLTFGLEKAKERFAGQINTEQTYLEKLKKDYAATTTQGVVGDNNAPIKERLILIQQQIKLEEQAEQKKNDDLLKEFQSYTAKRAVILKNALDKANRLRALNDEAGAQLAIDEGVKAATELDNINIKKWASYKNLFDNLERLSKKQTLIAIAELQRELQANTVTAQAKIELQNKIDKLKKTVTNGSGKDIEQVAQALGRVASEFNSINSNIGNVANVVLQAAQSYVQVKKGIEDFGRADKKGDTLGKVSAGLGIAGAAIGVASSVIGYFKGLKEAKEKALKAMRDFQAQATKGELEYQQLLRKRETDDIKRGKNSYNAIIAQLELIKKQSPAVAAAYDKIFASLQGQSSISGLGYQNGTWLRKAKTWDIMASLSGSEYGDLEKLYLQGKLKDQAKADFESLKALREELKAAGINAEELQAQLSELLTGTTVSGLADGLTALFENAKFHAADLGKSFTEIMRKAIVNSFKAKYLEDQVAPFYAALADLMKKGTPTEAEIAALAKMYEGVGKNAADYWKLLEQTTGISLVDPNAEAGKNTGMAGRIREAVTEETASEFTAISRGTYDFVKQIFQIGKENQTIFRAQQMSLLEISVNTFNAVEELKKVNKELTSIKDNTASKLVIR